MVRLELISVDNIWNKNTVQLWKALQVNYFSPFSLHLENAHNEVAVKIVSLQSLVGRTLSKEALHNLPTISLLLTYADLMISNIETGDQPFFHKAFVK